MTISARLLSVAQAAQDAGESAVSVSMVFPNAAKAEFDARRYREQHLPLLKGIYGDSVERFELRTPRRNPGTGGGRGGSNVPSAPAPMAPPSPVLAAVNIWIRDLKAFSEKTTAASQQIVADMAQITAVQPVAQYEKVLLLLGDSRDAIEASSQVFSFYFPAREGGRFDATYYGEKVVPLMVSLYGKEAIRRIEFSTGTAGQGGATPPIAAASHFYIRNRQAWDAGGMKAYPQLTAEGPNYTTLVPIVADSEVVAVG